MRVLRRVGAGPCVCGEPSTVRLQVEWADGPHVYWYCAECAEDVEQFVGGAEILP